MRKTFAYNSIIFGLLLGMLAGVSTDNMVLGVLVCLGISVVGFVIIRFIENALYAGTDAAIKATKEAYKKNKDQKKEK